MADPYSYRKSIASSGNNIGQGLGALLNNFVAQRNQNTQNQLNQRKLDIYGQQVGFQDPNRMTGGNEIERYTMQAKAKANAEAEAFMRRLNMLQQSMNGPATNDPAASDPVKQPNQREMIDYGDDELNQIAHALAQQVASQKARVHRGTV